MPSSPRSEAAEPEDEPSKQVLSLDLKDSSRPPPSPRTPGYVAQTQSRASLSLSPFSCLPSEPSDPARSPSGLWGQRSESPLTSRPSHPACWGKPGFLSQRSLSMVETSSSLAPCLGWPEIKHAQSDGSSSSSSRYKTELCRSFTESGLCKYGGKCQFAHGPEELRDLNRHPKYKTEPCRTFHTVGFCPYGIRCHFLHSGEEEKKSSSFSSLSPQPPPSLRSSRPPLVKQSFSFAGFPSDPQQLLRSALPPPPPPPPAAFTFTPSGCSPSCADITELLSHAFLEMDSAFEASNAHQYQAAAGQTPAVDPPTHSLPSPDSGYSACGLSPTTSPSLRRRPGPPGVSAGPLGARSLSYASLSDVDQDRSSGSSSSSLSGSDSCSGVTEGNGRRLAVFSQLSVPEDATAGDSREQEQDHTHAERLHAR